MRYLWVDDFDGGQNEEILKERWLKYYRIEDKDLVNKKDLVSTLEYISEKSEQFDAVLLDIRFPVSIKNHDEELNSRVYDEYFKKFITKEFYNKQLEGEESGTGILVYLYLIFATNFPKERIAFLSANIEEGGNQAKDSNDKVKALHALIDHMKRNKFNKNELISIRDQYDVDVDVEYEGYERREYIDYVVELLESEIVESESIEASDIKSFEATNRVSEIKNNSYLAYNAAKKAFENIGIHIEHAYMKPGINGKEYSEDFDKFIGGVETDYVKNRRKVFNMVEIILEELSKERYVGDLIKVKSLFKGKQNKYDIGYFKGLLEDIKTLPTSEENSDIASIFRKIIWSMSHCMENVEYPSHHGRTYNSLCKYRQKCDKKSDTNIKYKYFCNSLGSCSYKYDRFEYASHLVLYLTRNWLAHEKLKTSEYDMNFFLFTFSIGLRFIFAIEKLARKDEYIAIEKELFADGMLFDDMVDYDVDQYSKNCSNELKPIVNSVYHTGKTYKLSESVGDIIINQGGSHSTLVQTKRDIYKAFVFAINQPFFTMRQNKTDYAYGLSIDVSFIREYTLKTSMYERNCLNYY